MLSKTTLQIQTVIFPSWQRSAQKSIRGKIVLMSGKIRKAQQFVDYEFVHLKLEFASLLDLTKYQLSGLNV